MLPTCGLFFAGGILRIGNGGSKQGRVNRTPINNRNLIWKFSIDRLEASWSPKPMGKLSPT